MVNFCAACKMEVKQSCDLPHGVYVFSGNWILELKEQKANFLYMYKVFILCSVFLVIDKIIHLHVYVDLINSTMPCKLENAIKMFSFFKLICWGMIDIQKLYIFNVYNWISLMIIKQPRTHHHIVWHKHLSPLYHYFFLIRTLTIRSTYLASFYIYNSINYRLYAVDRSQGLIPLANLKLGTLWLI